MKICDFTKPELDRFRKECNFTEIERRCFDLKAKGMTNYQLAMELNICDSTVSSTMKSIRAKITAVSEAKPRKQEAPRFLHATARQLAAAVDAEHKRREGHGCGIFSKPGAERST